MTMQFQKYFKGKKYTGEWIFSDVIDVDSHLHEVGQLLNVRFNLVTEVMRLLHGHIPRHI